ncbi:MAG: hypothetical protein ACYCXX_10090 [Acidiferrobacter thiooxydans]|jgi:hypothetical protein
MSRQTKRSTRAAGGMVGGETKACACTPKRGRPASPTPRAIRNAEAARRYRARKREEKEARRDPRQPLRSAIIDLSAVPPWRRV